MLKFIGIVQLVECRSPKPKMQVRVLLPMPYIDVELR